MAVQRPVDNKTPRTGAAEEKTAYDEIIDFLASLDPAKTIAYHPSEESSLRLEELIGRAKGGALTDEEAFELEECQQFEHLMRLVKARARLYLAAK